jgi:hypothetical protein
MTEKQAEQLLETVEEILMGLRFIYFVLLCIMTIIIMIMVHK